MPSPYGRCRTLISITLTIFHSNCQNTFLTFISQFFYGATFYVAVGSDSFDSLVVHMKHAQNGHFLSIHKWCTIGRMHSIVFLWLKWNMDVKYITYWQTSNTINTVTSELSVEKCRYCMLDLLYKGCLAHWSFANAVTLTFGLQVIALPSFMWVYEKFYFHQSLNQYASKEFISCQNVGSLRGLFTVFLV